MNFKVKKLSLLQSTFGVFHHKMLAQALNELGDLTICCSDKRVIPNSSEHNENQIHVRQYLAAEYLRKLSSRVEEYLPEKSVISHHVNKYFDNKIAKYIIEKDKKYDIGVVLSDSALYTIRALKSGGAKTFLDRGSQHIIDCQKILNSEYKKIGEKFNFYTRHIDRCLQEYEEADYILIPSDYAKESFMRNGISSAKLIVVPYGTEFASKTEDVLYGMNGNTKRSRRVLIVGTFSLQKGALVISKICKALAHQCDIEFMHCGAISKDGRDIIRRDQLDKYIDFQGYKTKKDLNRLMMESWVLLHPSVQDGLAVVIPEALASGMKVLCSAISGGGMYVDQGVNGYVIDNNDPDEYIDALIKMKGSNEGAYRNNLPLSQKPTAENYIANIKSEILKNIHSGCNLNDD